MFDFFSAVFLCVLQRLYHGVMQFNTSVGSKGESQPYYLPQVEEEVEISDNTAVISVPPPRFRPGDPAYILHDFNRVKLIHRRTYRLLNLLKCLIFLIINLCVYLQKLTAYLDLTLRTCFVIPLNTSVVLPPQDLIDLFSQLAVRNHQGHAPLLKN